MLKSLEDYLANLSFDPPNPEPGKRSLDAGERAFVEKYLGEDAFKRMPVLEPEPIPLPQLLPRHEEPKRRPVLEPQIIVAPKPHRSDAAYEPLELKQAFRTVEIASKIVVATEQPHTKVAEEVATPSGKLDVDVRTQVKTGEDLTTDQAIQEESRTIAAEVDARVISEASAASEVKLEEVVENPSVAPVVAKQTAPECSKVVIEEAETTCITAEIESDKVQVAATEHSDAKVIVSQQPVTASDKLAAAPVAAEKAEIAAPAMELSLRDKMRQAAEIQVVSFFVAGQLFLLPVAGIQEVLRHMELVKVPQAPDFVAGAINLRGTVMPLIHLSALLTNASNWEYDEQSFIIVTGSNSLQMGLIIDKVSSMHLIPQKKIIWNAESKLGEAAEFLSAIVDLDDKVCGMIAPDLIAQKLFSEF